MHFVPYFYQKAKVRLFKVKSIKNAYVWGTFFVMCVARTKPKEKVMYDVRSDKESEREIDNVILLQLVEKRRLQIIM